MLNQTLSELNKKLQGDVQKPPFNPGGGVFTGCIGCGEEVIFFLSDIFKLIFR